MLAIDTTTGMGSPLFPLGGHTIADLAWDGNHGVLYGASTGASGLYRIDLATGQVELVGSFGFGLSLMHGLEYDSNHDVLYGITNQTGTKALYSINVNTAAVTLVGVHGVQGLMDLAFDRVNDVMYAAEAFEPLGIQRLHAIDLNTGATTLLANVSGPGGVQIGIGLAYDPLLGLFASDNKASLDLDDALYRIDPMTGQATLVGAIGGRNVIGLTFIPEPQSAALLLLLLAGPRLVSRRRRSQG
jgi:hypothetical protein